MRLEINKNPIFIVPSAIASVSIFEDVHWDTKQPIYRVDISLHGTPGATNVYTTSDKDEAISLVETIGDAIEIPDGVTYLDGFKDGTEYALKLLKIGE